MPDHLAPTDSPCCSRCGPDAHGEMVPFGYEAETFQEAATTARDVSSRLGCDVFVVTDDKTNKWVLQLQAICIYRLAEHRIPKVVIDHLNHPAHFIGKPFHIRGKNMNLEAALELAGRESSIAGSSVMVSYGPDWCVNVRTTAEEAEQANRLASYFYMDESSIWRELEQIDSFSEYVRKACDHL